MRRIDLDDEEAEDDATLDDCLEAVLGTNGEDTEDEEKTEGETGASRAGKVRILKPPSARYKSR